MSFKKKKFEQDEINGSEMLLKEKKNKIPSI